jgi:hypothetical protein
MARPEVEAAAEQAANDMALAAAKNAKFEGEKIEIDYEGYKFTVDTDLLDNVEIVDLIERIEGGKSLKAVVEFLYYLIGKDGYEKMQAYFVEKEGRFKLTRLSRVYYAIFEKFDPKG